MSGPGRKLRRELRFALALWSAHRLRTALTLALLLLGGAAAIVTAAFAAGARERLAAGLRALGTDLVTVSAAPAPRVAGRARQLDVQSVLRPADAAALAEQSRHAAGAAAAVSRAIVAHASGWRTATVLLGTSPEGLRIRGLRVAAGRAFGPDEEREQRRVVLLGRGVARALFGTQDPLGQRVTLERVPFEVIGLLAPRGTDPGGSDLDNLVAVPLSTAMRRVLNVPYVHHLFVQARRPAELALLEAEVRAILLDRHPVRPGRPAPFLIQNQAILLRTERGTERALRRLSGAVTAAVLGLGGSGILAVMLLAARERRAEVGLRRAVGARRADIRRQFLLEASLLALAGGGAGVVVGLLVAAAGAALGGWALVLPWREALFGTGLSLGLGLAGGVLPATRAARMEPREALSRA